MTAVRPSLPEVPLPICRTPLLTTIMPLLSMVAPVRVHVPVPSLMMLTPFVTAAAEAPKFPLNDAVVFSPPTWRTNGSELPAPPPVLLAIRFTTLATVADNSPMTNVVPNAPLLYQARLLLLIPLVVIFTFALAKLVGRRPPPNRRSLVACRVDAANRT